MILYLHGFRSSPQSTKARQCAEAMAALGRAHEFVCPQLSVVPVDALEQCHALIRQHGLPSAVIGSSLGGFYATCLAEQYGCRAVLINPAVHPDRDLADQIGLQTFFHTQEEFEFRFDYLAQLQALKPARITQPQRYLLLAAKGDEVLDWREMVMHYAGAVQIVLEGSTHAFEEFADYLPQVLTFCGAMLPGETHA